ncbi:MAG: Blue-light-activated protein [Myxococcales bacterium]|nr:Blue-light-activated protein [Myxococcales bacterium]
MDERVTALERECAELRRQLAATQRPPLADAAAFLESLLTAVPAFIVRTDGDMRLLYVNHVRAETRMEAILGRELWEFLDPDSVAAARTCIAEVLATGLAGAYEATANGLSGPAYFETFVAPLTDPAGRLGVCLVAVDVTRLHLRDLELRRREEELRVAVEATGIGLWRWNPATNEVHWYPRTYEIYGRSVPVNMMDYVDVLVHPDDREVVLANTGPSIAGGPFSGPIHRIVREDGGVRWILARGRTELGANGQPVRMIGGSLDVTQQRELEEQLRHAQRLDAVGHLTAGVAHNFNNMLTVVTGTLEVLGKRVSADNRRLVDGALEAALRSAEMVRQLMTFTGQRAQPERRPQDIGGLIMQVVEMCRHTFDRHITLSCTVAPNLPMIRCTPNEIEQVLMNLLVNARDAVADGGRPAPAITVAVDSIPDPRGSDAVCARITVTDDGIGMTDDVILRAFDPFFTTKEVGRGTGLGLTTSFAIVRELEGAITCESAPGHGSTFVVCLPGTAPAQPSPARVSRPATAPRRILLVDDDEFVRRIVISLLTIEGFEVEPAASGEAALTHLATCQPLDVILLDRSMPGAPGETYVPRIRALAPGVPIMMFTGQAVAPGIAALVDRVILKPVSGAALVEAIDALIVKSTS